MTALRFFAAFAVFSYHFLQYGVGGRPQWLRTLVGSGYLGVTLFFILSGFILVYVYHDTDLTRPETRREFFVHRIARIYPVYLLAWLLFAAHHAAYCFTGALPAAFGANVAVVYGGVSLPLLPLLVVEGHAGSHPEQPP